MTSASFDFAPLLTAGLPPPAARWTGFCKYNFIGGHNDAGLVPVDRLIGPGRDVASAPDRAHSKQRSRVGAQRALAG